MTVGVTIPFFDHQSDYETVLGVAKLTEECGYDSVWMADHITGPTPNGATRWMDVITLLSNLAAHVTRVRVGTDILVVPYRHPVATAKVLTTLDIVSGGRLVVGTGVGYIEREFRDLGVSYADRGALTTESIEVWRAMWSDGPATYHGKFFHVDEALADPKPVQRPGPPVWVGGGIGPATLRRVVAVGDGWHPIYLGFDDLATGVQQLRTLAAEAGRADPITLSYSAAFGQVAPDPVDDDKRLPLTGGVDQVKADAERLRELGFTNLVFRFGAADTPNDVVRQQIEFVAEHVLPAIRG